MTDSIQGGVSRSAVPPVRALGLLAAATLVCLVPFINKAYCIDDPLFLWAAAQIQAHPFDFYGCSLIWYKTEMPLHEITKNPPLACYYIALVTFLAGWSEPVLHAAFLLPAMGTIWGTWYLARSFCNDALSAGLVTLVTPVFLVSSTDVMCDTMLLCAWVWALALWIQGLETRQFLWLGIASVLIAVASLTKYFGICLIPLLGVHTVISTFVRGRRIPWELLFLLIPITILAGYQAWTSQQYGRGLLFDAADYATAKKQGQGLPFEIKTVIALSFTGGCLLPVVFCMPWLWQRRRVVGWLGLSLVGAFVVGAFLTPSIGTILRWGDPERDRFAAFDVNGKLDWNLSAQLVLFVAWGLLVLWLAINDFWTRRTADSLLLGMWVFGTFAFAGYVNWACNGRSVLPIAPALGILVVRRIEYVRQMGATPHRWSTAGLDWRWSLIPAAAVGLMVAWSDYCLANAQRDAASFITKKYAHRDYTVWFQGHWGFQYYMELQGAKSLDFGNIRIQPNDKLVIPFNNTNLEIPNAGSVDILRVKEFPACPWLGTLQKEVGAGFYADIFGPLPFVFAHIPTEKYVIYHVKPETSRPDSN